MNALDTSVVVAAFASWHQSHALAVEVLDRRPRLPAHVAVETFSVLTRLPPPHRAAPEIVAAFLEARFQEPFLVLPEKEYRDLLLKAKHHWIVGGAIYDALVAITALHAEAKLLSLDQRASSVYQRLGVDFEILGQ